MSEEGAQMIAALLGPAAGLRRGCRSGWSLRRKIATRAEREGDVRYSGRARSRAPHMRGRQSPVEQHKKHKKHKSAVAFYRFLLVSVVSLVSLVSLVSQAKKARANNSAKRMHCYCLVPWLFYCF